MEQKVLVFRDAGFDFFYFLEGSVKLLFFYLIDPADQLEGMIGVGMFGIPFAKVPDCCRLAEYGFVF